VHCRRYHLNKDSHLDVIVCYFLNDILDILFLVLLMVHFQVKPFYPIEIGSEPNGIAISELNNDSCFDIVIVNSWYNNTGIFL
jgi:hypothetical protein